MIDQFQPTMAKNEVLRSKRDTLHYKVYVLEQQKKELEEEVAGTQPTIL